VHALLDAGHVVRMLVRAPERIARALDPLGVQPPEHAVGDVTDTETVRRAEADARARRTPKWGVAGAGPQPCWRRMGRGHLDWPYAGSSVETGREDERGSACSQA
jgi:hypothetical protein